MVERDAVRLSRKSQEVHPRNEDDICWSEEGGRPSRSDCVSGAAEQMNNIVAGQNMFASNVP